MKPPFEPTIPGAIWFFILALGRMILGPVVWWMRMVGRAGERLSQHKEGK